MQNMNVELVAQMFKNYQSNVLFHLEGMATRRTTLFYFDAAPAAKPISCSNGQSERPRMTTNSRAHARSDATYS